MAARAEIHHVLRSLDGGWSVWREGAKRASKRFDSKKEAVSWGRTISQKQGTEFVVHRQDGTVQEMASHGKSL